MESQFQISVWVSAITRYFLNIKKSVIGVAIAIVLLLTMVGYTLTEKSDTKNITTVKKETVKALPKSPAIVEQTESRAKPDAINEAVAAASKDVTLTDKEAVSLYEATVFLVKKSEGLFLYPYYCSAHVLTIGWGHTYEVKKGKLTDNGRQELLNHSKGITLNQANEMFRKDFLANVDRVAAKLNTKDRAKLLACTSVSYNSGMYGMMQKGTAVGATINKGKESDAQIAQRIRNRYVKGTKYEKGIKVRRGRESLIYLEDEKLSDLSERWGKDVDKEIHTSLDAYGLQGKFRGDLKPLHTRSKQELSYAEIMKLVNPTVKK